MTSRSCTLTHSIWEQFSTLTHTIEANLFSLWADGVKVEHPAKIQTLDQPEFFQNLQSFADCSMKMLIRYDFLIDLESIHNKLSSDYSLNICFSRRFPCTDGQSFSQYKLSIFEKLVTCRSFANCTHLLTRTQEKKSEEMFLVKIENKGFTLSISIKFPSFACYKVCFQSKIPFE